jgi:hypothetical protein
MLNSVDGIKDNCMSAKIVLFNIIYYSVFLFFIKLGRDDPSSSLGYGYFIVAFWIMSIIVLAILLLKQIILFDTVLNKIGILTATPVLPVFFVGSILLSHERSSEAYFNKSNYRYKEVTIEDRETEGRRIEYYRSKDTLSPNIITNEEWLKDSTWLYLSQTGDTIKKATYKNNIEVK